MCLRCRNPSLFVRMWQLTADYFWEQTIQGRPLATMSFPQGRKGVCWYNFVFCDINFKDRIGNSIIFSLEWHFLHSPNSIFFNFGTRPIRYFCVFVRWWPLPGLFACVSLCFVFEPFLGTLLEGNSGVRAPSARPGRHARPVVKKQNKNRRPIQYFRHSPSSYETWSMFRVFRHSWNISDGDAILVLLDVFVFARAASHYRYLNMPLPFGSFFEFSLSSAKAQQMKKSRFGRGFAAFCCSGRMRLIAELAGEIAAKLVGLLALLLPLH
jgi:hypothetical protein